MAVHGRLRQSTAVYGSSQQFTAVHGSSRQFTAVHGSLRQSPPLIRCDSCCRQGPALLALPEPVRWTTPKAADESAKMRASGVMPLRLPLPFVSYPYPYTFIPFTLIPFTLTLIPLPLYFYPYRSPFGGPIQILNGSGVGGKADPYIHSINLMPSSALIKMNALRNERSWK